METGSILTSAYTSYSQTLDLSSGVLHCSCRFSDSKDHVPTLKQPSCTYGFTSSTAAIQWKLTPENWMEKSPSTVLLMVMSQTAA